MPIRPSVVADPSIGSNEDDLTVKLSQIITVNNVIRCALEVHGSRHFPFLHLWLHTLLSHPSLTPSFIPVCTPFFIPSTT